MWNASPLNAAGSSMLHGRGTARSKRRSRNLRQENLFFDRLSAERGGARRHGHAGVRRSDAPERTKSSSPGRPSYRSTFVTLGKARPGSKSPPRYPTSNPSRQNSLSRSRALPRSMERLKSRMRCCGPICPSPVVRSDSEMGRCRSDERNAEGVERNAGNQREKNLLLRSPLADPRRNDRRAFRRIPFRLCRGGFERRGGFGQTRAHGGRSKGKQRHGRRQLSVTRRSGPGADASRRVSQSR